MPPRKGRRPREGAPEQRQKNNSLEGHGAGPASRWIDKDDGATPSKNWFETKYRSAFNLSHNDETPSKTTDTSWKVLDEPAGLYCHTNALQPIELEPYAYVLDAHGVPFNTNCVLRIQNPTRRLSFGVRTIKCTCSFSEPLTCRTTIPIGASPILFNQIKHPFGTLEGVRASLEVVNDKCTIPTARKVGLRVVEPPLATDLVDNPLPIYTLKELRQIKNAVSIIRSQLLTSMLYAVHQIYCLILGARHLFIFIESFESKQSGMNVQDIFQVSEQTIISICASPLTETVPYELADKVDCPEGLKKIGGMTEIKKALEASIIFPLTHPDVYFNSDGTLKSIRPPKGVLLYGIPGTGKTYLTKAIVEEITLRWSNLESVWRQPYIENISSTTLVDGGPSKLAGIFESCRSRFKANQQTFLIFDEIDVLCPQREVASAHAIEMLTILLTELDGQDSCPGVMIVGTTNRPEALDAAIRRPGRLDQELEVDVPNYNDRIDIILKRAKHHNVKSLADSIDMASELARDAHGFVPSDIDAWFLKAFQVAQAEFIEGGELSETLTVKLEHFKRALVSIRPSGLKDFALEIPKLSWDDIGGYEAIKSSLKECIEWPLRYDKLFTQMGLSAPRGILLYGPPGNSKTILAKAVASEAKMNFISIKGPEIFSKWVGESEKTIRTIFRKARQHAPTVIFLDEIDALGCDRQSSAKGGSGVEARVLSQMLNEMDGIGSSKQVIIIGATNRPDLLDAALLRPGRFDRLIYVSLPDREARRKILAIHLRGVTIQKKEEVLSTLADRTEGYSGAEIAMICTETRMAAVRKIITGNAHTSVLGDMSLHLDDFLSILNGMKPRTSQALLNFYQNYQKKV